MPDRQFKPRDGAYLEDAARDSQFTEVPQGTKQFEPWT
jgi:hypothetical protein